MYDRSCRSYGCAWRQIVLVRRRSRPHHERSGASHFLVRHDLRGVRLWREVRRPRFDLSIRHHLKWRQQRRPQLHRVLRRQSAPRHASDREDRVRAHDQRGESLPPPCTRQHIAIRAILRFILHLVSISSADHEQARLVAMGMCEVDRCWSVRKSMNVGWGRRQGSRRLCRMTY